MSYNRLKIKMLRRLAQSKTALHLSGWIAGLLAAQAAFCSTNVSTYLRVHPQPDRQDSLSAFLISVDSADPVAVPVTPASMGQAVVSSPADQPAILVNATEQTQVELDSFPGWRAVLPPQTTVWIEPRWQLNDLLLTRKGDAAAAVGLFLPDGARAELTGESATRFEQFDDGSYLLFAQGTIQAHTADGAEQVLNEGLPPLSGGPIVEATNRSGQVRLRRLSPSMTLRLEGAVAETLIARTDPQQTILEPGQPSLMSFAHGAAVQLEGSAAGLRFAVARGYFVLSLPGGTGCEPHFWSGQSGRIRWDQELQAVEVAAERGPILVGLPNQSHATVASGSALQFAKLNEHSFAASAAAGTVHWYDSVTRRLVKLSEAQTAVRAQSASADVRRVEVALHADAHGRFVVSPSGDRQRQLSRVEEDWALDAAHVLTSSADQERVTLQATLGNLLVRIPAANIQFELDEPNAMVWRISPHLPISRGEALAANPTPVVIHTQSGRILLAPGGELLVSSPSWSLGLAPQVIFSEALEAAGGSLPAPLSEREVKGTRWLLGLDPGQIYAPRVEQPPVSVVR